MGALVWNIGEEDITMSLDVVNDMDDSTRAETLWKDNLAWDTASLRELDFKKVKIRKKVAKVGKNLKAKRMKEVRRIKEVRRKKKVRRMKKVRRKKKVRSNET